MDPTAEEALQIVGVAEEPLNHIQQNSKGLGSNKQEHDFKMSNIFEETKRSLVNTPEHRA